MSDEEVLALVPEATPDMLKHRGPLVARLTRTIATERKRANEAEHIMTDLAVTQGRDAKESAVIRAELAAERALCDQMACALEIAMKQEPKVWPGPTERYIVSKAVHAWNKARGSAPKPSGLERS